MRQWILTFLAALSFPALIATGVLYAQSFLRNDNLSASWASLKGVDAMLYRGSISVSRGYASFSLDRFQPATHGEVDRFDFSSDSHWQPSYSFRADRHNWYDRFSTRPATHLGFYLWRGRQSINFMYSGRGWGGPFYHNTGLGFPLWLPTILFAAAPLVWLGGAMKLRKRQRQGLCENCGYDLRASAARCPECGRPFLSVATSNLLPIPRRRLSPALAAAVTLIACAIGLFACRRLIADRQRAITRQFDVNRDFWTALDNDDAESALKAIGRGAEIDLRGNEGGYALFCAVGNSGAAPLIRLLVERGANPNYHIDDTYPLTHAIRDDEADVVEILLNAGADPNAAKRGWPVPLQMAIIESRDKDRLASLLIAHGADVKRDFNYAYWPATATIGYSPLFYAVIDGCKTDTLKAMVQRGADWRGNDRGAWLLSRAFGSQNYDAARFLIELGADNSHTDRIDVRKLEDWRKGKASDHG